MGVSGQRHAPAALYPPRKDPRYPFDRRLRRLGGEEVWLLLIHDLGTRWVWMVSVTPRQHFNPGEGIPGTHCTEDCVGLRAGLDTEARWKIILPLPGIQLRSPGRPPRSQTLYRLSYSGSPPLTERVHNVLYAGGGCLWWACEADEGHHTFLVRLANTEHLQAVLLRLQRNLEQERRPEGPVAQHLELVVAVVARFQPVPANSSVNPRVKVQRMLQDVALDVHYALT
jgi:hypothetical protein